MTKQIIECECNWTFNVPYRPCDSDGIIHVHVEAHCNKCGEERVSDYSWEIDRDHTVTQEGEKDTAYECDECYTVMDEDMIYEGDDNDDLHFCSKKCHDSYWGEEE
jgi:hypothetical protein